MKWIAPNIYKKQFLESGFMLPVHSRCNETPEYFSWNYSIPLSIIVMEVFHVLLLRKHLSISVIIFTFCVLSINTRMQF